MSTKRILQRCPENIIKMPNFKSKIPQDGQTKMLETRVGKMTDMKICNMGIFEIETEKSTIECKQRYAQLGNRIPKAARNKIFANNQQHAKLVTHD